MGASRAAVIQTRVPVSAHTHADASGTLHMDPATYVSHLLIPFIFMFLCEVIHVVSFELMFGAAIQNRCKLWFFGSRIYSSNGLLPFPNLNLCPAQMRKFYL